MAETLAEYEKLERRYNSVAPKWRGRLDAMGYPEAYRELLYNALPSAHPQDRAILDAGTGCGAFAEALVDVVGPLRCIDLLDISVDMLAQAEARLTPHISHIQTRCGPLEALRADANYDLILCAHVVEHCADHQRTLEILRAALKPGGRLILVASKPHWCTSLIRFIWGHKAFTPNEMMALLGRAGFEDIVPHPFPKGPPRRTSFGYSAYNSPITERKTS